LRTLPVVAQIFQIAALAVLEPASAPLRYRGHSGKLRVMLHAAIIEVFIELQDEKLVKIFNLPDQGLERS